MTLMIFNLTIVKKIGILALPDCPSVSIQATHHKSYRKNPKPYNSAFSPARLMEAL
jgi:hypothetical protein